MEKNIILNADILDIIFDGKNKLYGAYELRKSYNKRLIKAIFLTFGLVLFAFLGTMLFGMGKKNLNRDIEILDARLAEIRETKVLPPPIVPPKPITPPVANQVKYTAPVIVKDNLVNEDEVILEIKDDQQISSKTFESEDKSQIIQAPVEEKATTVLETPKANANEGVFEKVEKEAEFPGGLQAWSRYLQKNLNPNVGLDNGAVPGTYQVIVKFIVSKEGVISDVTAETKHGFGMEEEAVKIIKRGPKWTPALQNGQNVNAYRRQPVTFLIEDL